MRKRDFRLLAALLLAALLLGGCGARFAPDEAVTELRLYAVEGAPFADALPELLAGYGESEPYDRVLVTRFADEAALEAALRTETPELLLCSARQMKELREQGLLHSLALSEGRAPRFLPAFQALGDALGGCYFPLGAALDLLVVREERGESYAGCDSLEALCAAASAHAGDEAFGVDSFAALYASVLSQKGLRFSSEENGEAYRDFYNLLAQTAFDGALRVQETQGAAAVCRGELTAALCASRSLAGLDLVSVRLLPVPACGGGEACSRAEIWGMAVLAQGEKQNAAARFVTWLCSYDRAVDAALREGLLPAEDGRWLSRRDGNSAPWAAVARRLRFYLPEGDTMTEAEKEDFDQRVREALLRLQF